MSIFSSTLLLMHFFLLIWCFVGLLNRLVLENLSHRFLKPNILDIKLGTVLYDEDASEEKKARMDKTAKQTTSSETGIRLTGFQVRFSFLSPSLLHEETWAD